MYKSQQTHGVALVVYFIFYTNLLSTDEQLYFLLITMIQIVVFVERKIDMNQAEFRPVH